MIAVAPSSADTAEQTFINRLDANNIHYGTRSQGLAMGHAGYPSNPLLRCAASPRPIW